MLWMFTRNLDIRSYDVFCRLDQGRLASVPFAFYQWVVDRHARTVNQPFTLWVVSDAKKRVHPTLKRLQRDLGAKVFQDMDNTTNPWLGDFAFVQAASYVVVSTSTFSWWSAFLSHANIIYTPLLPLPTLLPWCKLLPEDPRYVFHDFYADETFNTSGPAKARCQLYERCRKQKTCVALGRLVSQYYPASRFAFGSGCLLVVNGLSFSVWARVSLWYGECKHVMRVHAAVAAREKYPGSSVVVYVAQDSARGA